MAVTKNINQDKRDNFSKSHKLRALSTALLKIQRDTGEDENDYVFFLKKDCGIILHKSYFEFPRPSCIAIWVDEPFSNDLYLKIINELKSYYYDADKNCIILDKGDLKFIHYPVPLTMYEIDKDIFEQLENEHGISNEDFKCYEWEYLQNSDIWKRTQIQVAREIIAEKIYKELFQEDLI